MKKDLEITEEETQLNIRDVTESAEMQRAQAEIQAAFFKAVKFPRDEEVARGKLEKAVERPTFADAAFYSYPRGQTEIFGPSVNLAREFARHWGNVLYGTRIVHDAEEMRTIEGYAWDIETNVYIRSQGTFQKSIQRKDQKTGQTIYRKPDERDLRELTEKHAAILYRNCILRLAPRDLIDAMVDKARGVVKGFMEKKEPKTIIAEMVKAFSDIGVYQEPLEKYCQENFTHGVDKLTAQEITELRGVYRAIREGVASRQEYFNTPTKPGPSAPPPAEEVKIEDIKHQVEPAKEPTPVKTTEYSMTEAEKEAVSTAKDARYRKLLKLCQHHCIDFKKPDTYEHVVNECLKLGADVAEKCKHLEKKLDAIGVDFEKELNDL